MSKSYIPISKIENKQELTNMLMGYGILYDIDLIRKLSLEIQNSITKDSNKSLIFDIHDCIKLLKLIDDMYIMYQEPMLLELNFGIYKNVAMSSFVNMKNYNIHNITKPEYVVNFMRYGD